MKRPKTHFESYEEACAYQKLNPEDLIPVMSEKAPEWLKNFLEASGKLAVICEGMRDGRKPKPGELMYYPVFFKDSENGNAGFGLAGTYCDVWNSNTNVGERLSLFTREDAHHFGKQFLDLHKATKII